MLSSHVIPKYSPGKKTTYVVRVKTFKPTTSNINLCIISNTNECVLQKLDAPFDKGMRDMVFDALDIGDIDTVIAAPEAGSWGLEELEIWVDNGRLHKKCMYYDMVGERGSELAAVMKPCVMLTPEHKQQYDEDYVELKQTLMNGTLQTVIVGAALTGVSIGAEKALAYTVGGGLSLLYLAMLQYEMDVIGKQNVSFAVVRLASVFGIAAALVTHFRDQVHNDESYFILALIGFMSFKASVMRLIKFD